MATSKRKPEPESDGVNSREEGQLGDRSQNASNREMPAILDVDLGKLIADASN